MAADRTHIAAAPTRLDARSRNARDGDMAVFAVNGFLLTSWLSRTPDVTHLLSLSPGRVSILLLAISAGAVLGLPPAGRIAHRLGASRTVLLGAAIAIPGGLLSAAVVDAKGSYLLVAPGLFLFGLGNGLWDVAQNIEGSAVEHVLGKAIMPWFHAAFSVGSVAAALIAAVLTWLNVALTIHIGVVCVISTIVLLRATKRFLPTVNPRSTAKAPSHEATRARSSWTESRTLLIGLVVLAAAFAEGSANDWIALAFVNGHHVSTAMGVLALAIFLSFMTAGRILGTKLLDRFGRVPVLRLCFATSAVGCALTVFCPPWLAFIGSAVWGIGTSLGFPVGISAAADDPHRAPQRISVVSTIGYIAFLAGPPLLGFLGDHFGVLRALITAGIVSVCAILIAGNTRPLAKQPPTPALTR